MSILRGTVHVIANGSSPGTDQAKKGMIDRRSRHKSILKATLRPKRNAVTGGTYLL